MQDMIRSVIFQEDAIGITAIRPQIQDLAFAHHFRKIVRCSWFHLRTLITGQAHEQ